MTRQDGFSIADVSTSLLDDPKFKALWRGRPGRAAMNQAVVVYMATVLESWRTGERCRTTVAAPMWLDDISTANAALHAVELIDDDGRIPEHVWEGWYGPAADRRDVARAAGREGNRKRWHPDATVAPSGPDRLPIAMLSGGDPRSDPIRSDPTVPTAPSEGEQSQLDETELHPVTKQPRKRTPAQPIAAKGYDPEADEAYALEVDYRDGRLPRPEPSPETVIANPFDLVYGRFPKPTTREWYDRLVKLYPGKVDAAMREAIKVDPDPGTLLSRTETLLRAGTQAAIAATTSAKIAAEVAARTAERAARAAQLATEPPFVAKGWRAAVALSEQLEPPNRSAEIKAKQTDQRRADRKTRLEHPESRLPASPVASLPGIARMSTP